MLWWMKISLEEEKWNVNIKENNKSFNISCRKCMHACVLVGWLIGPHVHGNIHTSVYVSALRHPCWEGVSREPQRGHTMFKHAMSSDIQHIRGFLFCFLFLSRNSSISIELNTDADFFQRNWENNRSDAIIRLSQCINSFSRRTRCAEADFSKNSNQQKLTPKNEQKTEG